MKAILNAFRLLTKRICYAVWQVFLFKNLFEKHKYRNFVKEYHEPRSTANFVVKSDHRYMVGALSRMDNNSNQLSNNAKNAEKSGMKLPSKTPT